METLFYNKTENETEIVGKLVQGELPEWLNGTLIRTGPGKWDLDESFCLNHFLDGCAMMVKFEFDPKNKQVRAKSKYLQSEAYQKMCAQKRPVFTEFGTQAFTDQSKSMFSRVFSKIVPSDLTDNDISNIYKLKDEVYLTTESCNIWQINPSNLDSVQKVNLDKVAGIAISCSHPIVFEEDNAIYNVGSTFLTGMKYHIMKVPTNVQKKDKQKSLFENSSIICSFNSSYKASLAYNHSFSVTKNYVIVIEQSLLVNGLKLATCTPKGKSLEECLEWCPDEPSIFHVFDKRTNSITKHKFHAKGFFFFHTINAFEVDDQIVIDILNYEDNSLLETLRLKNLRKGIFESKTQSKPTRYVLPVSNLKEMKKSENLVKVENCQATAILNEKGIIELTGQSLGPSGFEMPTINSKFIGKPYNFIYGTGFLEKGLFENAMGKIDINKNETILYKHSSTTFPGEGIFVPLPESKEEDDGVILTLALEIDLEKNPFVAVLDAKTLNVIARIEFDRKELSIPTTLHGLFVQNE